MNDMIPQHIMPIGNNIFKSFINSNFEFFDLTIDKYFTDLLKSMTYLHHNIIEDPYIGGMFDYCIGTLSIVKFDLKVTEFIDNTNNYYVFIGDNYGNMKYDGSIHRIDLFIDIDNPEKRYDKIINMLYQ